MMKIKLNQGTVKEYKTGVFVKETFPIVKEYLQTMNKTERKMITTDANDKNMNKISQKKKG